MPNNFEVNDPKEEPQDIRVELGEWVLTQAPNFIETKALGPCAGVIIYNPETKQALVGHFADYDNSDFPDMLEQAKQLFPNIKKLKVYLGGVSDAESDSPEETKETRTNFEQALLDQGFDKSQITIRWQDSDQVTTMKIDPSTGQMDYDTETLDDLNSND